MAEVGDPITEIEIVPLVEPIPALPLPSPTPVPVPATPELVPA